MKYQPLQDRLRSLPDDRKDVSLQFNQIEKIIGAKLPMSALSYREWWGNQQSGSRAPHWLEAGFKVESVDLSRKFVRFVRSGKAGTRVETSKRK